MEKVMKKFALISALLASGYASAGTTTWEWDLDASVGSQGATSLSADGTNGINSNTLSAGLAGYSDTGGAADNHLETGQFYYYGDGSGWGFVNQDETEPERPGHAFDNQGNIVDYDMALISFDTSVELTGINFGYRQDGDFTLLAYTGSAPFVESSLNGSTWAAQQSSGNWLTVGQYNGSVTDEYYAVNSGQTSSQYWLLGAFNSLFGEPTDYRVDNNDDAFKIRKLRGNTETGATQVSSPAAFALLLMGSAFAMRRRRQG